MDCWYIFDTKVRFYLESGDGPIQCYAYDVRFPQQQEEKKQGKIVILILMYLRKFQGKL